MNKEYISLKELIYHYSPAYSNNWKEWFTSRTHDKSHLVFTLAQELLEKGEFEEPVILSKEHKIVVNGMHRIMAYYLAGISKIYVSYECPAEMLNITHYLCAECIINNNQINKNWDNLFVELSDNLSWRYTHKNEQAWIECVGDYSNKNDKELYFYTSNKNIDIDKFKQELEERLSDYHVKITNVSWQNILV